MVHNKPLMQCIAGWAKLVIIIGQKSTTTGRQTAHYIHWCQDRLGNLFHCQPDFEVVQRISAQSLHCTHYYTVVWYCSTTVVKDLGQKDQSKAIKEKFYSLPIGVKLKENINTVQKIDIGHADDIQICR